MQRISIPERQDWKAQAQSLGFSFHTIDGEPYWDESAYYVFGTQEVETQIEDPTLELHQMCMDLVPEILRSDELMHRLEIPAQHWDYIRLTWEQYHPHLYGRMDLAYTGQGPAKLLELNYDTPTSLYETAYFQWTWLEDLKKQEKIAWGADQYNSVQEQLIGMFTDLRPHAVGPLSFASVRDSIEDRGTVDYLRDCALQAGWQCQWLAVEDLGVDADGRLTDLNDFTIPTLFKLYPWEYLLREEFAEHCATSGTLFIEPAWKSVLSNKGILPLLWERHKGHPNLLEAYFDPQPTAELRAGWVRKPLYSREGANVQLREHNGQLHTVDGPYDDCGQILQALAQLPRLGNSHALIGSWVVGDVPCGMGIREDAALITKDSSRFLPHILLDL
jgi:glutathionylspermidine synthase